MTRDDFDSHLTACVREAATILYSLERDFESAKSAFAEDGKEEDKLRAEDCLTKHRDINGRLNLFGFKHVAKGWISPFYSKFFSNFYCGYCNQGFIEQCDLADHAENCMKTAIHLKNLFHLSIKSAERQLATSPRSAVLLDEINELRTCHSHVSFKLLLNDGISLENYIL